MLSLGLAIDSCDDHEWEARSVDDGVTVVFMRWFCY